MFSDEVVVDGLVEVLVVQLSEAFCDIVGPVQYDHGVVSMFFFVGRSSMLSCRLISFIVIMVSRLLLPIGRLYLLIGWSLRQLVSLKGPILVPSVALTRSSLK